MKHRIFSAVLSTALLLSTSLTPITASAETVYASAEELLNDVIEMACKNIDSSTKDTAIDSVISKITVVDDEVFYDSESIGYWYSESSNVLYTDSSKTDMQIEEVSDTFAVDASLLSKLLTDVNNELTEVYTPTSTDWSKIIGKYDVALGNVTIPADNWVDFSDKSDDYFINISRITGITISGPEDTSKKDWVVAFSWLVDENNELYISSGIEAIGKGYSVGNHNIVKHSHEFGKTEVANNTYPFINNGGASYLTYPWITLDAVTTTTAIDATFSASNNASLTDTKTMKVDNEAFNALYRVNDPSISYTGTIDDATNWGIAYYISEMGSDPSLPSDIVSSMIESHNNFWTTFETSKTIVGNSLLTKRISKLNSLNSTDLLTISYTGWDVNGLDIDTFLNTQSTIMAGGTVDVDATAEVEGLNFKATLPTALPIYISRSGSVTTATNAEIKNESNSAIAITNLEINAKPGSDWTLVNTTPSQEKDAKEFSFTTSLNINDTINVNDSLPFTYEAAFSPEIYNLTELNVATVSITLDWAS